MSKSLELSPEISGFEEKVGTITIHDHDVNDQRVVVNMEFPVDKEVGITPHEDLVSDLEKVAQRHYSE